MPRQPKKDPEKFCDWCGTRLERKRFNGRLEDRTRFLNRSFCNASCAASHQHSRPPTTDRAGRKRALRHRKGRCESCTESNPDKLTVHHIDGNPRNNEPTNLQTLCVNCHSFYHAWLRRIGKKPAVPMPRLVE